MGDGDRIVDDDREHFFGSRQAGCQRRLFVENDAGPLGQSGEQIGNDS